MCCDYYSVLYNDVIIASHMTLETALLLVSALFVKHDMEPDLHYTIKKEEYTTKKEES